MKKVDVSNPLVISQILANQGLTNNIPQNASEVEEQYNASQDIGFPAITMRPISAGGEAPDGKDFNGFLQLLSSHLFASQNGGVYTFNQGVSTAIGGYPQGAILSCIDNDGNFSLVQSLIDDNTYDFVSTPSYIDGEKWQEIKLGGSANLPLFYSHRFPSKPQDTSWINSEDYSWLYGGVGQDYTGAYDYLIKQYSPTGKFEAGDTYYTITFSDGDMQTTDVTVASGTVSDLQTWATTQGYTATGSTIEDLVVSKTLTASTETIEGTTITFYRCFDKKKIILPAESTNCDAIYSATGIAEYFILDTTNTRFKLPRNKWGYYGTGSGELGDYIPEKLPNAKGYIQVFADSEEPGASNSAIYKNGSGQTGISGNIVDCRRHANIDLSRSSPAYQDNAPVQPRGVKGDLYFYLGSAGTGAVAEIAGIKAETINSKADTDLNNVSHLSGFRKLSEIYSNGASWYKVYDEYDVSTGDFIGKWCEQGGILNSPSGNTTQTINFLKPYNNTNYKIFGSVKIELDSNSIFDGHQGSSWATKDNTYFKRNCYDGEYNWRTEGYLTLGD